MPDQKPFPRSSFVLQVHKRRPLVHRPSQPSLPTMSTTITDVSAEEESHAATGFASHVTPRLSIPADVSTEEESLIYGTCFTCDAASGNPGPTPSARRTTMSLPRRRVSRSRSKLTSSEWVAVIHGIWFTCDAAPLDPGPSPLSISVDALSLGSFRVV